MISKHTSVFARLVLENLDVKSTGRYIDCTYGSGGHSKLIAEQGGNVLALEWDIEVSKEAKKQEGKNLKIINSNFANIEQVAGENNFIPVEGIIFDLGISMDQISGGGRGFSYKKPDEPLDMRINTAETERVAADIVNSYGRERLYEIFARYSEEVHSGAIADAIVRARRLKKITKVSDLISVINKIERIKNSEKTIARIFQALRIEVNEEIENLRQGLQGALKVLVAGGKIVIITFHPVEDRFVKKFCSNNKDLIKAEKVIIDRRKKFERSAQLRVLHKA